MICYHKNYWLILRLYYGVQPTLKKLRTLKNWRTLKIFFKVRNFFQSGLLHCGYKYTRPCMINRIWSLYNNGYRWMVMLDFIRIVPAELFWTGTHSKRITRTIYPIYKVNISLCSHDCLHVKNEDSSSQEVRYVAPIFKNILLSCWHHACKDGIGVSMSWTTE